MKLTLQELKNIIQFHQGGIDDTIDFDEYEKREIKFDIESAVKWLSRVWNRGLEKINFVKGIDGRTLFIHYRWTSNYYYPSTRSLGSFSTTSASEDSIKDMGKLFFPNEIVIGYKPNFDKKTFSFTVLVDKKQKKG